MHNVIEMVHASICMKAITRCAYQLYGYSGYENTWTCEHCSWRKYYKILLLVHMVPVNGFSANSNRISKQRSLPSERVRYACTLTTALLLQRY